MTVHFNNAWLSLHLCNFSENDNFFVNWLSFCTTFLLPFYDLHWCIKLIGFVQFFQAFWNDHLNVWLLMWDSKQLPHHVAFKCFGMLRNSITSVFKEYPMSVCPNHSIEHRILHWDINEIQNWQHGKHPTQYHIL